MKQAALIGVIILISAVAGILAKEKWDDSHKEVLPAPKFESKITTKRDLALVTQDQHFTDTYGFYRVKLAGETRYLYSWVANQQYGVKIPKDWDWGFKYNDRVVSGNAPELIYFGDNVDMSKAEFYKIEEGFFIDETEALKTLHQRIKDASVKSGEETLNRIEVEKLAKLSLEDILLGILQSANPDLGILKINVNFKETSNK